jgi:hypothetical protein
MLQRRIRLMRGHVVVCGLGYVGTAFVHRLREAGVQLVGIEVDPAIPGIELCRSLNIPVVVGDAQLARTLHAAGVPRAARLLAVCSQDAVNTEIVAVARRLTIRRPDDQLRCLAQIGDPQLRALLRIQQANVTSDSSWSVDFFHNDETGAWLWLEDFPINAHGGRPHMLVSRLDGLATWLVRYAAREWCDDRTDDTPLWVTVVDDDAEERVRALIDECPALELACRFRYSSTAVREVHRLAACLAHEGAPPISRAYVTAYRDEEALEAALVLRRELDAAVPLVVAFSRAHEVGRTIGELTNTDMFPALERTCTIELVQGGFFERIAVAIYRRWRDEAAAGQPRLSWGELDESRKESSRAQARDIAVNLRSIGCAIAPLRDWDAQDFTFSDEEVERLAIAEHDRWLRERIAAGWTLGDNDVERKNNLYMVPWENLPPNIAEYDRIFVREIPAVLASAGFQIIRVQ